MSPEEALKITRIARAAWPAQRWDEYTIDVWVGALIDQDFGQIREAMDRLVKVQTFASISEILLEARQHQRNAIRQIHNRRVLGEIEAARESVDRATQRAGYEEATRVLQAKLAELHPAQPAETEGADA